MTYTKETILQASLAELIEMAIETYQSEENQRRLHAPDRIRFITGIGRSVFSKAFGFRTMEYYNNPEICLRAQLQWKLYTYHVIRDSNYFDLDVGIDYSTAYEPSLFGMQYLHSEGMEPTYGNSILEEAADYRNLELPDFYKSGLMPKVHEMYQALQELCGKKLRVFFPGWSRGPWSTATIIRGFQGIFEDALVEPEDLHELMQFVVDSRIHWENQRCQFLGIDPTDRTYRWKYIAYRHNFNSDMFEDEVDGKMFSKKIFDEFVLPYTEQLCDYYGGIGYYHSCGDLTNFFPSMYPALDIFGLQHVSSWTDYQKAAEIVPQNVVLQYSLHTTKEALGASDTLLVDKFRYLMDHANGHRVDICADALYEGSWDILERAEHIREIFQEIAPSYN